MLLSGAELDEKSAAIAHVEVAVIVTEVTLGISYEGIEYEVLVIPVLKD